MINDTRKRKLKLRPVTYLSSSQVSVLDIPHGYIWSPHLVPKPKGNYSSDVNNQAQKSFTSQQQVLSNAFLFKEVATVLYIVTLLQIGDQRLM